jgi:hypothetical protein
MYRSINEFHIIFREKIVDKAQQAHYYLTFFTACQVLAFYEYFSSETKGQQQALQSECESLLQFVNSEAKLVHGKWSAQVNNVQENYLEVLCAIGEKLYDLLKLTPQISQKMDITTNNVVADVVIPGRLHVASCSDKELVPNVIMSLYANHGFYPQPWQLLICRSSTSSEELQLFTRRCFHAARNGFEKRLFCIASIELLDFELQYKLVKDIRELQQKNPNFFLALVCCQETGVHHHVLDQFSEYVRGSSGLDFESMTNIYMKLSPNVTCVTSDLSGQGKTEHIKQASLSFNLSPRSILVNDMVDFSSLVHKLKNTLLHSFESLHFNIVSIEQPEEVNMFLFELLTLGMVYNKADIALLPRQQVFIEVASTIDQYLLNLLPMVKYVTQKHITWNINNFVACQEIASPIQVVAHYLEALENHTLDNENVCFVGENTINEPISTEHCCELIQRYFLDGNADDVCSFRYIEIFLNVFADQLVRLSASSFFQVENIQVMVREKNIRTTLLNTLLDVSKEFATKSIHSRTAQLEQLNSKRDQDKARLASLVQWDDSNHLLVFFLSQMPDSIIALYRNREHVPQNVKKLLWSQLSGKKKPNDFKNWILDDYHTMASEMLLAKLETLARTSMNKLDLPPYALSADNLLKMALILLRARANIPVVMCGEAGCGKVNFVFA